ANLNKPASYVESPVLLLCLHSRANARSVTGLPSIHPPRLPPIGPEEQNARPRRRLLENSFGPLYKRHSGSLLLKPPLRRQRRKSITVAEKHRPQLHSVVL